MIKKLRNLVSFGVLAAATNFIFQSVAAKTLSVSDFGIFARWLTDITYLGFFMVLGLDHALLYFSKNLKCYPKNATKNFIVFTIILCFLILLCFFGGDFDFYELSLCFTIYFFAIYQSANAYNQLTEKINIFGLFSFLRPFALLAFMLGLGLFKEAERTDLNSALLGYSLVSFVLAVVIVFYVLSKESLSFDCDLFNFDYFVYGFKSMFTTFLAISLYTATIYALSYLLDDTAVAYFFLASAISKLVWVVPDSAGNILYPKFLKIGIAYHSEDIEKEMFFYAQVIFAVNLICLLGFFICGGYIINIIYGEGYQQIFWPTIILLIGNQGMVFYKILSRKLASENNWSILRLSLILAVISNIGLNFLLIPSHGINGAAIATAVSFWICGLAVSCKKPRYIYEFMRFWNISSPLIRK